MSTQTQKKDPLEVKGVIYTPYVLKIVERAAEKMFREGLQFVYLSDFNKKLDGYFVCMPGAATQATLEEFSVDQYEGDGKGYEFREVYKKN